METKQSHTPTPWKRIPWDGQIELRSSDNSSIGIVFLGNREDGAIPNAETRANAAFIVKVVNMHEELLARLTECMYHIKELNSDFKLKDNGLVKDVQKLIAEAEVR